MTLKDMIRRSSAHFLTLICLTLALLFAKGLLAIDWAHQYAQDNLMRDLLIVDYWNKRNNERLPVLYNHYLQGGYFNMPSARMGEEGEVGAGYSHVPPYRNYNLRMQLLDRLEVSGNYRVFRGVDDPILSPLGFGDLSDKGANVKFALFHPEDSDYTLPGLAVGLEDFMGTKNFNAQYVVLTQVFLKENLEVSLGYGGQRIRGWFGGAMWMPFRRSGYSYLENFSLVAEYDATPYKDPSIEKHPRGRKKKSFINWGFKHRLWNQLDFSLSRIRGDAWAWSVSTYYNLGTTKGLLPKIDDPRPYQAPINTQPLGCLRPEETMVQDFLYAMREQGLNLLDVQIYYNECMEKVLRLKIENLNYALEDQVRERLNHLLASLVPDDIDLVVVVIDEYGMPIQQYTFYMSAVRAFANQQMGPYELKVLTPLREVDFVEPYITTQLFHDWRNWVNMEVFPKTHTFFGSSRGKFKYALGLNVGFNGFLPGDVYYNVLLGYVFFSNLNHLSGVDRLNPSRLINVRTDVVRYYQQKGLTVDQGYLQKNWAMGNGWFSRLSGGYFEEAYAGLATEFLYFPINSPWAIGFDAAILKKRSYQGLGFTNKIRQIRDWQVRHKPFNFGSQCFLDIYYNWKELGVDFKIKAGKFLANDWGARYELTRHFPSGLRVSIWYTTTNGRDRINGQRYYDKGIEFSMPLDIFFTSSDRDRWRYGLSAWLRDVGVTSATGDELYNLIYEQRNNR